VTAAASVDVGVTVEEETGSSKHGKSQIQGLYKPPTHDELQALKETQNLFKTNLMKLQVKFIPSTHRRKMNLNFLKIDYRVAG